jgi:hypothetical protein
MTATIARRARYIKNVTHSLLQDAEEAMQDVTYVK